MQLTPLLARPFTHLQKKRFTNLGILRFYYAFFICFPISSHYGVAPTLWDTHSPLLNLTYPKISMKTHLEIRKNVVKKNILVGIYCITEKFSKKCLKYYQRI